MSVKHKIKKGDEVMVLSGRSKGQTGKVDQVVSKTSKVYVSGVNVYKKHQKPGNEQSEGGIKDKPMPLPMCAVAFIDPKTKKPSKIGFKVEKDTGKTRISKASGSAV